MQPTDYIWMDGKLVPWEQATVHVLAHALHYGTSVFEGIRAYNTKRGPAVLALQDHTRRLFNSAKMMRMEIPYTEDEINNAILETLRANNLKSAYIRPLVFRGMNKLGVDGRGCPVQVAIATIEWGRYLGEEAIEQGVDVGVSSWRRMAPGTLMAMGKIGGQYVNSQLVAMEAHDRGFAEGIALDIYGYVSEGSGENLFLVFDGVVYTPPTGNSILMGITRKLVMQLLADLNIPVKEQVISREMLYIADELFFTGTAAEVTPIRSVDGIPVGSGRRGPITEKVQREFFGITSGEIEDRHGWLTYVYEEAPAS
ncbi:branched-chain amino acid aminotransferase [Ardenticatena maritima]|uniref:Branched-chain-amino-acid aminotransferase n=1 Tax=Ardenticatena maritima TaxID=872965 RepID=A0A0M9UBG1_9CHLR|nr:branched-chain amino acid transaminase [Ardenticatena maritima]KPL87926.1 branched-chain amino acid aminotransferase [Ardenticatena maritima]GAP61814.1 branched-chain amino acid aminotransferase [Ardenticatena maritima]